MVESNKARIGLGLGYGQWLYAKGHVTYEGLQFLTTDPAFQTPEADDRRKEQQTLMEHFEEYQRFVDQSWKDLKLAQTDPQKPAKLAVFRAPERSQVRLKTLRTPVPVEEQKYESEFGFDTPSEPKSPEQPCEVDNQRDSNFVARQPKKRISSVQRILMKELATEGFRSNRSLNNQGPREPTLNSEQLEDFRALVMIYGTDKISQFPKLSGTFQHMKPDFLMRTLYNQLACTSILEFQDLQIDVLKVQKCHKKLVEENQRKGNTARNKDGRYVNGQPKPEQLEKRKSFWRQHYSATQDQLDKAWSSVKLQKKSLNKSSEPLSLEKLVSGSTIEKLTQLKQYEEELLKKHKQVVTADVKAILGEQSKDPLSNEELCLINAVNAKLPSEMCTVQDKQDLFQQYLTEAGHLDQNYIFEVQERQQPTHKRGQYHARDPAKAQYRSQAEVGSTPDLHLVIQNPKKQSAPAVSDLKKRRVKSLEKTEKFFERQDPKITVQRQPSLPLTTTNPEGTKQAMKSQSSTPNNVKRSLRERKQ